MSEVAIIPRTALVQELTGSTARVVIVRGASGAGKTTLLEQAIAAVGDTRHVSGPANAKWTGALLQLVLRGLSDIVTTVIDEQGATERITDHVSGALRRIAENRGREFAVAAGKELLGIVRHRLGPEVGNALAEAVQALRDESGESLAARLDRAQPETALDVIVQFASEVAAVCDGKPALIVLDRCDRLDEQNLRLLMDLAEDLPVSHRRNGAGVRRRIGTGVSSP